MTTNFKNYFEALEEAKYLGILEISKTIKAIVIELGGDVTLMNINTRGDYVAKDDIHHIDLIVNEDELDIKAKLVDYRDFVQEIMLRHMEVEHLLQIHEALLNIQRKR